MAIWNCSNLYNSASTKILPDTYYPVIKSFLSQRFFLERQGNCNSDSENFKLVYLKGQFYIQSFTYFSLAITKKHRVQLCKRVRMTLVLFSLATFYKRPTLSEHTISKRLVLNSRLKQLFNSSTVVPQYFIKIK